MSKNSIAVPQNGGGAALSSSTLFADIRALFKAPVLIANVLPVLTGFWLALYFTGASFNDYWDLFFLTVIGSTLVMAGALVINNWYDVDIDTVMDRTKHRPTVTGHFSLKMVLTIGITLSVLGFILLLFTTIEAAIYALVGWVTYCFFIYHVVKTKIYSKYRYRECFWGRYPFNWLDGNRIWFSYHPDYTGTHFVYFSNAAHLCDCH